MLRVMLGRDLLEADAVRAFEVFAEHRSFTAAAAALHLSQPSLHAKIGRLQTALGVPLYERHGRGLRLTVAGERLAVFARDAGRRADDLVAQLHAGAAPITLAAGRGTFRWVVSDGLRRLGATGRPVRVRTADREAALGAVTSGQVDVAVVAHDRPPPTLESRQVAVYPQTLVVARRHPLARRESVLVVDLEGLALVVPPPERVHRRTLERALGDAGVSWQVAAEVDGWDLLVHFAAIGLGATVVNGCVRPPRGLAAVPIADLPVVRYWAAWRPERGALAEDVLQHLVPTQAPT